MTLLFGLRRRRGVQHTLWSWHRRACTACRTLLAASFIMCALATNNTDVHTTLPGVGRTPPTDASKHGTALESAAPPATPSVITDGSEPCEALRTELAQASPELAQLRAQLTQKTHAVDQIRSDDAAKATEVADFQAKLREATQDIATKAAELATLKSSFEAVSKGKAMLAETIAGLNTQQGSQESEIGILRKTIQEQSDGNSRLTEEKEQLARQIGNLTTGMESLTVQLDAKHRELLGADEKLRAQDSHIAALEAEVAQKAGTIESHLSALNAKSFELADLQADVEDLNETIDSKKAEAQKLLAQVGTLTENVDAKTAEASSLQAQLVSLNSTFASKSAEADSLQSEVEDLNANIAKQTSEAEGLQSEVRRLNTVYSDLTKAHTELAAQYADPSVQHFLTRKAIKVYNDPGIHAASNKTFVYMVPSLLRGQERGEAFINQSQALLYSKLHAYVDNAGVEPYLPAVTGYLVYGMVVLPLLCTMWCLTRVMCKLKPCLLFLHLYFALTSLCGAGFAIYTGADTFNAFAMHDASVYLVAQAGIAVCVLIYSIFLCMACMCSKSGSNEFIMRCCQILLFACAASAYYTLVFTPAMLDERPRLYRFLVKVFGAQQAMTLVWLPYVASSALFFVLLRLEQIAWRSRGPPPKALDTKKNGATGIAIREDGELRGVVELANMMANHDDPEAGMKVA